MLLTFPLVRGLVVVRGLDEALNSAGSCTRTLIVRERPSPYALLSLRARLRSWSAPKLA
jgi:hypothetical protein